MRQPGSLNKIYSCTSGPDGTQCRRCERAKMRIANRKRSERGDSPLYDVPVLTQQEVTEARKHPCPCEPCRLNRQRAAKRRAYPAPVPLSDAELDRKALEGWNPAWGARA